MDAAEALVKLEKASKEIREVAESDLADEMLKEDAQGILEDLEMLESELRDVQEAADSVEE